MANNFYASYPVNGGGVSSLNGLTGALTLVGTNGITITPSGSTITISGSGGTVTSVGLVDSTNLFNITGSPVTSSGSLTLSSFKSQTANTFFAAPSGSSGAPTFRAIVAADLPSLSGTYVPQSEVGAANGVASLDSSGKVPVAQLPSVVMEYEGAWNPNTNTPTLSDGTGTNGNVYYVTALRASAVSGNTDPSMVNFQIGDLVIYSSSVGKWQLVTPAAGVQSVNGAQGAVTVNAISQLTGDVTAGPASGSASAASSLVATSNATLATLSALTSASNLATVGTITSGTWNATAISATHGGTGQTTYATGDTLYASAANTLSKLTVGSTGNILTVAGGVPTWAPPATGGTVTSVGLSAPAFLTVGGSPVTGSGTLALTLSGTALPVTSGGTGNTGYTAGSVIFSDGTNLAQDNAKLFWDNTNFRLGIGTAIPGAPLTISLNTSTLQAPSSGTLLHLSNDNGTGGRLLVDGYGTNGLVTFRRADTTAAAPSAVQLNEALGLFNFVGYGTNAYSASRANFAALAAENWTNSAQGTYMQFSTTAAGGTTTNEKMRISDAGNIGIGTTTPSAYLNIKAGTATAGTSPLKFTAGVSLTLVEAGAMEYDGTFLYFTPGATRLNLIPMTTGGDLIYGGASGAPTRLANGSSGQVLTSAGSTSAPTWSTLKAPTQSIVTTAAHSGGFPSNSTGTYTTPTGAILLKVTLIGSGGGGGGCSSSTGAAGAGGGGGGGGAVVAYISSPASTYSYTAAAIAAGGTAGANSGTNGNNSTFSTFTAGGGLGGGGSSASTVIDVDGQGGGGGSASGGTVNIGGSPGTSGLILSGLVAAGGTGGAAALGGGGGLGGFTFATGAGANGSGPGGGGAGGVNVNNGGAFAGGTGAAGIIIVEEFYQ